MENTQNNDNTNELIIKQMGKKEEKASEELKLLLKYAYKEYEHIIIDRQRNQVQILQQYFWFAALIVGSIFTLGIKIEMPTLIEMLGFKNIIIFLPAIISLGLAIFCLGMGIDTLRGRELVSHPFGNITPSINGIISYSNENKIYPWKTFALKTLAKATPARLKDVCWFAKRLRLISVLLNYSVGLGVSSIVLYIIIRNGII